MSKTLSQLRSSQHVGRPERTHPVCIARKLTARYEALQEESEGLRAEQADLTPTEDERERSNRRAAEGPDPRLLEIATRLAENEREMDSLAAEMEDHTGDVLLRAASPEEWQRWVVAHPPRGEGEPGFRRDYALVSGVCNADDLIADLHLWAKAWNGEALGDGDWTFIAENAPMGSLKHLAYLVTAMHEGDDVSIPKSRRASSTTPEGETA